MKNSMFKPDGGLNSDVNDRDLPETDYRMMRNLESGFSHSNKKGVCSSLKGTKLVGERYGEGGILGRKVIGTASDMENNAVIEFVNTNIGLNIIRRVFKNEGTSEIIYEGALSFTQHRITHANVVNGMLMWSQKGTYPKKLNIKKAKLCYDSSGANPEGYPFIDYQTMAAGAFPPNFMPTPEYTTVKQYFSNFVNKNLYQFAYYYIYDDGEVSQLSPCSKVIAPLRSWSYLGGKREGDEFDNAISIKYNTGHHKVKEISFVYRTSLSAPWRIFTTVNKLNEQLPNLQEAVVIFYGNEATSFIPIAQRNYDYIPIESECQEYVHTSNLIYGNYVAGLDKPESTRNIDLYPTLMSQFTFQAWAINNITHNTMGPGRGYADLWFNSVPPKGSIIKFRLRPHDLAGLPASQYYFYLNDDGTYTIQAKKNLALTYGPLVFNYEVTQDDVDNGLAAFVETLRVAVDFETYRDAAGASVVYSDYENAPDSTAGPYSDISADYTTAGTDGAYPNISEISSGYYVRFPWSVFDYDIYNYYGTEDPDVYSPKAVGRGYFRHDFNQEISPLLSGTTLKSIKSGTFRTFGINYYDDLNRDSTVVTSDDFKVYIPFAYEVDGTENALPINKAYKWVVRSFINHRPPMNATHYKWVVSSDNKIKSFGWRSIKAIAQDTTLDSERIKITLHNHTSVASFDGSEIRHVIAVNDIVRPVLKDTKTPGDGYFADPLEVSVLEVNDTGTDIIIYTENFNFGTYGLAVDSLLEIYTVSLLKDDEEAYWFEIGEEYRILDANTPQRRHEGEASTQSPDLFTSAETYIDFADVWVRQRKYQNGGLVFVEDYHFSDYFPSNMNDRGRVAIYDSNAKRRNYPSQIIHGGKYFADTQVNDLFSISATSAKPLALEYGAINSLVSVGYVLKAYQSYKSNSIYIGRTVASNTDDTTNEFQLIDGVIGTITPSGEIWGCRHPESVTRSKRYVYFFDVENGVWVRDAANGLYPISDYGYKTYWGDKAEAILKAGIENSSVLSAVDERNNLLITSVHEKEGFPLGLKDMVLFHEESKRWKVHIDTDPEAMCHLGNEVFFFKNSDAYQLFAGDYNKFFGTTLKPKITFVMKSDGWIEKVFDSLTLFSNLGWDVAFRIPKEYSASKRDMKSRIMAQNLQRDESTFHGEIKGDMLTPGYATEVMALLNGDTMRGKAIIVELTYTGSDYMEFYGASIKEQISNLSP